VCLSVCPKHNSKTTDPNVFKLGVENDLGISYTCTCGMALGLKGQWSRLELGLGLTAIRRGFELCECLLVYSLNMSVLSL